jgi:iron complex transport system ATP-binding protein
MPTPILQVSGLRIARGDTEILRGLDWRVARGEHWVILGPNGCGKTSLLRAMIGYMAPSAGDIALLGRRHGYSDWRELRLKIGVTTSSLQAAIPPAETALETVISGRYAQLDLWTRSTPSDIAAARRLLRLVGATPVAGREWAYLSQGERQRVLIARSLMARPRLLILDEPCAGLDPVARERFLRLIDALARRRRGPALVLVTHHVEEITPRFSHVLILRAGRALASGPRAQVLTSANLSAAFGTRVKLVKAGRGLRLKF